jgi:sporulation protein YlmC with PRC-barrel domain
MTKKLALAAMAAALLSTTVFAQSSPPAGSSAPAAKPMDPVAIQSNTGKWRASKLVGLDVYNANNEKIGDINELITDPSGKIDIVVIGAGGFLGMGEHNVGIPFSQMKFVNEPVKGSTTTTGTGATTTTTTTTTSSSARDYPDHATVNMTKEQLKALPAFKYASDASSTSTTTTRPANQAPTSPTAR